MAAKKAPLKRANVHIIFSGHDAASVLHAALQALRNLMLEKTPPSEDDIAFLEKAMKVYAERSIEEHNAAEDSLKMTISNLRDLSLQQKPLTDDDIRTLEKSMRLYGDYRVRETEVKTAHGTTQDDSPER